MDPAEQRQKKLGMDPLRILAEIWNPEKILEEFREGSPGNPAGVLGGRPENPWTNPRLILQHSFDDPLTILK